jgi:hypothetical protein
MPLLLEVRKEAAGDLCRLHQWPSFVSSCRTASSRGASGRAASRAWG